MAEVFFDNPPTLIGKETDQLMQLQRYLGAMSDKLNMALMDISLEQMAPETKVIISDAQVQTAENFETLKSMIVKTAEIVRHEMDEISVHLEENYTALSSKFGTYEANFTNDVTLTAQGVLQQYNVIENITMLQTDSAQNKGYWNRLNGYIYTGVLDNGKVGIAIGENVSQNVAVNKMATFTSDRLSFWKEGTEVAYFSDNVFHISNGEIDNTLKIGNHSWRVLANGAMALVSG